MARMEEVREIPTIKGRRTALLRWESKAQELANSAPLYRVSLGTRVTSRQEAFAKLVSYKVPLHHRKVAGREQRKEGYL